MYLHLVGRSQDVADHPVIHRPVPHSGKSSNPNVSSMPKCRRSSLGVYNNQSFREQYIHRFFSFLVTRADFVFGFNYISAHFLAYQKEKQHHFPVSGWVKITVSSEREKIKRSIRYKDKDDCPQVMQFNSN